MCLCASSQGIYDPEPTIRLIKDYANLCRDEKMMPKKLILTFTPCGRRKTLEFIKWLGMQVPPEAEERMFAAADAAAAAPPLPEGAKKPKKPKPPVDLSCEMLCDHLRRILAETSGCGVPLGLNVESVSGFKDEIDATHDLFRSLQAILLDGTGSPWIMRWSRMDHVMAKRASLDLRRSTDGPHRGSMDTVRHAVKAIVEGIKGSDTLVAEPKRQTSPLQMAIMVAGSIALGALIGKK